MTNLLEPWVLLVLVTQVLAFAVALRAVFPAYKVLRYFDVSRATEGQLSLERQSQLSATFVRVAFGLQAASLLFFMLAADKLRFGIRGAMCAYGVFAAHDLGFPALSAAAAAALVAGIGAEVCAYDDYVRTNALARPLAAVTFVVAVAFGVACMYVTRFLLALDLTVVSSCCSVHLDAESVGAETSSGGPRVPVSVAAVMLAAGAIALGFALRKKPHAALAIASGIVSLAAVPFALGAAVLEVAPYAFETPNHLCPFCMFRVEEGGLGYFFFGAVLFAGARGGGLFVASLLSRASRTGLASPSASLRSGLVSPSASLRSGDALAQFARGRARGMALAWAVALAVGVYPVARFTLNAGGASLFR